MADGRARPVSQEDGDAVVRVMREEPLAQAFKDRLDTFKRENRREVTLDPDPLAANRDLAVVWRQNVPGRRFQIVMGDDGQIRMSLHHERAGGHPSPERAWHKIAEWRVNSSDGSAANEALGQALLAMPGRIAPSELRGPSR